MIKEFENKVFKTIEKYRLVEPKDKIFVALSGGKDSSAALLALKRFIEEKSIRAEVYAYHINLGFGYSDKLQEDVEKIAEKIGVKLYVTNLKEEYDFDIIKVSKITKRPICSVCGLVKRYLMSKIPRELGATKLATGHHASDFLIMYFKNVLNNNFEWNFKILPKVKSEHPKQLTRIRPLFFAFPEENREYCKAFEIPITEISCPYSPNFCCYLTKKQDSKLFEIINFSNRIYKDFGVQLLKSIINFNKKYKIEKEEIRECKKCGEPTNKEICAFCKLKSYLEINVFS